MSCTGTSAEVRMILREIVIDKARKAGLDDLAIDWVIVAWENGQAYGKGFERESCAELCEQYDRKHDGVSNIGSFLAHRIRARVD